MTQRARKLLLIGFIILFAVLAPPIILFSLGYRLNVETFEVTKTGAITLRTEPRGATIFLDGEEEGVTPENIRGLVPRSYHLLAEQDGHHAWEKTVRVKPQLVTEFSNVILPPLHTPLNVTIDEPLDDITFSPSGEHILGQRANRLIFYNARGTARASVALSFTLPALEQAAWSPNEQRVLFPDQGTTTMIAFDTPTPTIQSYPPNVIWSPTDSTTLFRIVALANPTNEHVLQRINAQTRSTETLPARFIDITPTDTYFLVRRDDPPRLERWSANGTQLNTTVSLQDTPVDAEAQLRPESTDNLWFLSNPTTGQTWAYNTGAKTWHALGPQITDILPGRDDATVVTRNKGGQVAVTWMTAQKHQPVKDVGDQIVPLDDPAITDVAWFPERSPHLLSVNGNAVHLTELDDRNGHNSWKTLVLRQPRLWTFANNQHMFIFSDGTLYQAKIP